MEEARLHVQDIREQMGLDNIGSQKLVVHALEKALRILADQLYQKSTRFLLELIQNADDNSYSPEVIPTLRLKFDKESNLRIDSNELGFRREDVDAICRIGESTKTGNDRATRYVGEKGIGFKSVFKVADVVWVSSKKYSFKFEKNETLGMIAPIWEPFPGSVEAGFTSFYMRLSPNYNKQELIDELISLDPRRLMFLRRLRHIHVQIEGHGKHDMEHFLKREDENSSELNVTKLVLERRKFSETNVDVLRYIVTRRMADLLPFEPNRPGISESELLLAFPINDKNEPHIASQDVYAFLPIRDYGFQFLLQADFQLIANREDINISSIWNVALLSNFETAVVEALRRFSTDLILEGRLRYTWVRYLPLEAASYFATNQFTCLKSKIRRRLSRELIVESESGQLALPTAVMYIPEKYRDHDGKPMTLIRSKNASKYLSLHYSSDDFKYLKELGVREMTFPDFFQDLKSLIKNHSQEFNKKPNKYHVKLAKILLSTLDEPDNLDQIFKLPLIQLRRGHCISALESPIFFPGDAADLNVPKGIDAVVVPKHALKDQNIHSLYSALGVKRISQSEVCQLICNTHNSPFFRPSSLSIKELQSHAIFLFKAGWKNPNKEVDLWFPASDGNHYKGSQLYQHSTGPYAATKFFRGRNSIHFVDHSFLFDVNENRDKWLDWLCKEMDLWTIPRLVQPTVENGFELSQDFKTIIEDKNGNSSKFLLLLRDHWQQYCVWLMDDANQDRDPELKQSVLRLRETLSSAKVKCFGDVIYPLKETFLPIDQLQAEATDVLPLLDIPNAEDSRWKILEIFGVGVKMDVHFYLQHLRSLASHNTTLDEVSVILEQIQARFSENPEAVKKTFHTERIIYVPPVRKDDPPQYNWIFLRQCLWEYPNLLFLKYYTSLKEIYPLNEKLFRQFLGTSDVQAEHLVHEVENFEEGDDLRYIGQIFRALNNYIKSEHLAPQMDLLRQYKAFPIRESNEIRLGFYDKLVKGDSASTWFIADRPHLSSSFRGVVPLLAFDVETVFRMSELIKKLGFQERMLSKVAQRVAVTEPPVHHHLDYRNVLRRKTDFIIRLISDNNENRQQIAKQLRNLEVYAAKGVQQRWSVIINDEILQGHPVAGRVALRTEGDVLKIYIRQEHLNTHTAFHYDLFEQLATFCSINVHHGALLLLVVNEDDFGVLKEHFEEAGVRALKPDEEVEEDYYVQLRKRYAKESQKPPKLDSRPEDTISQVSQIAEGYYTGNRVRIFSHEGQDSTRVRRKSKRDLNNKDENKDDIRDYILVSSDEYDETSSDGSDNDDTKNSEIGSGLECVITARTEKWPPRRKRKLRGEVDEKTLAAGELFFSQLLELILKENYRPQEHWTSKMRGRIGLGYSSYSTNDEAISTFTLPDKGGIFTEFLIQGGCEEAKAWVKKPPIYHVEVKGTRGSLRSEFRISWDQINKACDMKLPNCGGVPVDVYILVRVFDLREKKPRASFLVDPYSMLAKNQLEIEETGYVGRVKVVKCSVGEN